MILRNYQENIFDIFVFFFCASIPYEKTSKLTIEFKLQFEKCTRNAFMNLDFALQQKSKTKNNHNCSCIRIFIGNKSYEKFY